MDNVQTPVTVIEYVVSEMRRRRYSRRTEKAYVSWIRRFLRFHRRHPRDLGPTEVKAFLDWLATEQKVSASSHGQALCAILFLYRRVLGAELPWLQELHRPK